MEATLFLEGCFGFVEDAVKMAKILCVLHRRTTVCLPISPILQFDEN